MNSNQSGCEWLAKFPAKYGFNHSFTSRLCITSSTSMAGVKLVLMKEQRSAVNNHIKYLTFINTSGKNEYLKGGAEDWDRIYKG